ncbi:hypothetical protein ACTIVE_1633 [Actinomadura verrucosospora]|uniref:Uncharacterized protein n=1 Tax=Actinomadura verrucosospora TaxID=46165 RepID=A0A7D3ZDB6_ACTVE|nr:hypothetical protein ACTIVE_1633 [Actinomadura verrucosospora]
MPAISPPWVNGRNCTPSTTGRFQDVEIDFMHEGSWHCKTAESRPGNAGLSNVLGKDCESLHD